MVWLRHGKMQNSCDSLYLSTCPRVRFSGGVFTFFDGVCIFANLSTDKSTDYEYDTLVTIIYKLSNMDLKELYEENIKYGLKRIIRGEGQ
jgi:hypothetical protein